VSQVKNKGLRLEFDYLNKTHTTKERVLRAEVYALATGKSKSLRGNV